MAKPVTDRLSEGHIIIIISYQYPWSRFWLEAKVVFLPALPVPRCIRLQLPKERKYTFLIIFFIVFFCHSFFLRFFSFFPFAFGPNFPNILVITYSVSLSFFLYLFLCLSLFVYFILYLCFNYLHFFFKF